MRSRTPTNAEALVVACFKGFKVQQTSASSAGRNGGAARAPTAAVDAASSPVPGLGYKPSKVVQAQLAGIEGQHARPLPPPMQGCSPGRRLGHAGDQTSADTHGLLSGGVAGCCTRPATRRSAKAALASRRPCN